MRSIDRSIDRVRSRDFRTFRDRPTIDPRPLDHSARFVRVCDVQGARALRFNAHHRWDGRWYYSTAYRVENLGAMLMVLVSGCYCRTYEVFLLIMINERCMFLLAGIGFPL